MEKNIFITGDIYGLIPYVINDYIDILYLKKKRLYLVFYKNQNEMTREFFNRFNRFISYKRINTLLMITKESKYKFNFPYIDVCFEYDEKKIKHLFNSDSDEKMFVLPINYFENSKQYFKNYDMTKIIWLSESEKSKIEFPYYTMFKNINNIVNYNIITKNTSDYETYKEFNIVYPKYKLVNTEFENKKNTFSQYLYNRPAVVSIKHINPIRKLDKSVSSYLKFKTIDLPYPLIGVDYNIYSSYFSLPKFFENMNSAIDIKNKIGNLPTRGSNLYVWLSRLKQNIYEDDEVITDILFDIVYENIPELLEIKTFKQYKKLCKNIDLIKSDKRKEILNKEFKKYVKLNNIKI